MKILYEVERIIEAGIPKWRSWRSLRKALVEFSPECAVCGYTKSLECHHIIPRHVDPSLEFVWTNLINLCDDCHFHLGHLNNYKQYNLDIVDLAMYSIELRSEK